MSESKGTPGPWMWREDGVLDGKPYYVILGDRDVLAFTRNSNMTLRDAEPNARLIAAAPELLEALLETMHDRHGYCRSCGVYSGEDMIQGGVGDEAHEDFCQFGKARAAIAKALGDE